MNDNAQQDLFVSNQPNSLSADSRRRLPPFIDRVMQLYYEERVERSWQGKHILKGKTPGSRALSFSSNDYLNINHHPQLIDAQINALLEHGNGQMQSAVFLSDDSLLSDCERQFAQFLHYPAALLSQSGWAANIGLIQSLASRNLPIYLDFYAHMSFWEGAKAAQAKAIPFRHNSIQSLRHRLEQFGSGIIAVDSIYSTTGTLSPIADYIQLAREFDCLLIVDESHSLGTHGPEGRGLIAELGLSDQVDFITASLAKALSGRGGVIAGSQDLIELIRYTALPTIFSSTLLPHDLAGFAASIAIIRQEEWRREQLHASAKFLRDHLRQEGFYLGDTNSQIIPLIAGSERDTIWLRDELEKADIHGAVFCAPATPKNRALIRLSIAANHQKEDLMRVIQCLNLLDKQNRELPLFKTC